MQLASEVLAPVSATAGSTLCRICAYASRIHARTLTVVWWLACFSMIFSRKDASGIIRVAFRASNGRLSVLTIGEFKANWHAAPEDNDDLRPFDVCASTHGYATIDHGDHVVIECQMPRVNKRLLTTVARQAGLDVGSGFLGNPPSP